MTQYARPSSDITTTGITGVGSATLWQNVDESSANDSDYNWSTINAVRTYECKLSSVSLGGSGSYVVKYRLVKVISGGSPDTDEEGNDFTITVSLVQNTTVIASEVRDTSSFASAGSWNEYTLTLTAPQIASITDGANLRLRFVTTASGGGGSSRAGMGVSFCEFAIPDAPVEQYAVKNGNWNDTTVWSTGAVPTEGTVYSNNYTVTVDMNSSATVVTNVAGTIAVAGGGFALADGVTLTANCYAGAATCVTAGSGVGGAIVGDIYGGSSTNAYGFQKTGSVVKTVTVTGNSYGGSGTGANGILNSSNGPINQTGNAYGGSGGNAYGHRNSGSATDTITGNSYAGPAAPGVLNASSGDIIITGYSYAAGSVAGSVNSSSGNLTVGQNAIGGTSSEAYGARNYGSGTTTITGAAVSADSPGLGPGIANTGAGYATVGSVVTGTSGVSPCIGHVHVADLSAFTALVRSSSSSVTLSAEVGLHSPFEPSPVFGGA